MSSYFKFMTAALAAVLLSPAVTAQGGGAAPSKPGPIADAGVVHEYKLGVDDVITVHAVDAEELSDKPVRIDMSGYIRLPLIGRVKAAGLTVDELVDELSARLRPFITQPDVTVNITTFRSQPISVIGCVRSPGVHQLEGVKRLIEVLSMAGGLSDDAGSKVTVTRQLAWGRVPLPEAADDDTGQFSVATLKLTSLLGGSHPDQNIVVRPHDVISVPRAKMVYVTGEVVRSGGFVLHDQESISVLQALALAGGLNRTASAENTRILRVSPEDSGRVELALNLKKVLSGEAEDPALKADDILFIPNSMPKRAAIRALETAIQIGTGVVIWRR